MSWRSRVVARAAEGEARGLDVRALGRAVLGALPDPAPGPGPAPAPDDPDDPDAPGPAAADATPFADVLRQAATDDADVSRLFLATLFLVSPPASGLVRQD